MAGRQNENTKDDYMAKKLLQTKSPGSSAGEAKKQKPIPSQAQVAQMAYEIWISTGKQAGRDQQNWFEAEWQLRQM
jgi:DUF2934 family protein